MQREEAPPLIPKAFFWRRMHSFLGLWLVLYLFEHLLTNSEAALFIGADGEGFVTMVNFIHSLPYLPVIEVVFLAIPFVIHIGLGIKYLLTMKQNSNNKSDGSVPHLPEYPRNHAYTWQRITSWLLIVFVLLHVVQMRVLKYPETVSLGGVHYHMVKVEEDSGLVTLTPRIGVTLFDQAKIASERRSFDFTKKTKETAGETKEAVLSLFTGVKNTEGGALAKQELREKEAFINALEGFHLKNNEAVAVVDQIGLAFLMTVRETFKSPLMLILYTAFVLAAVYHACNGLWTFAVTWGIPLSVNGQRLVKRFALGFMALLAFLGLAAVWGTYLINLKY